MDERMNKKIDTPSFQFQAPSFSPALVPLLKLLSSFNISLLGLTFLCPLVNPSFIKGAFLDAELVRCFPSVLQKASPSDVRTYHTALRYSVCLFT